MSIQPLVAAVAVASLLGCSAPAVARQAGGAGTRVDGPEGAAPQAAAGPRFGIGIGASQSLQTGRSMNGSVRVGPLIQVGSWRQGWGPAFSFSATTATLHLHAGSAVEPVASARLRPILAGPRYRFARFGGGRLSLSVALLAGYAINRTTPDERAVQRAAARAERFDVEVGNALAIRPQVTLWIDLGPRLDLQFQAGYQVLRPQVVVTRGAVAERRRWNGDAVMVATGFAVGLF